MSNPTVPMKTLYCTYSILKESNAAEKQGFVSPVTKKPNRPFTLISFPTGKYSDHLFITGNILKTARKKSFNSLNVVPGIVNFNWVKAFIRVIAKKVASVQNECQHKKATNQQHFVEKNAHFS